MSDIPQTLNTNLSTYTDDTAILSLNRDSDEASLIFKLHLNLIENSSQNGILKKY